MRFARVIAILRHNTQLGGDLNLAIREFNVLMGSTGESLSSRADLIAALEGKRVAILPILSNNDKVVAMLWQDAPVAGINRILQRSAFAQEVIVQDADAAHLSAFLKECASPNVQVNEIAGAAVITLAWNYIIESEGVLNSPTLTGRVHKTVSLLLEPYIAATVSTESSRLRNAKKTTLSLSHDLHVYKAKFFPRMVRALLNIYGKEGQQVIDPFCGSGTALLEASLLGFNSVGIDIDPICQSISQTKVTPFFESAELLNALNCLERILNDSPSNPNHFNLPEELAAKIARRDRKEDTHFLAEIETEAAILAASLRQVNHVGPAGELLRVLASDAVTKKIRYRFVGIGNGRYTIEIVKQPLLERLKEKIERSRQLAYVFRELRDELGLNFGKASVIPGDARAVSTWSAEYKNSIIITSPPYLPASSGREHYASSRALAFSILGFKPGIHGYYDMSYPLGDNGFDVASLPEASRLMTYLASDASEDADPQRDAMRFKRKAAPTRQYLADMKLFLENARMALCDSGVLLLVVAHHHTFYSHRRNEVEHIVSGRQLYSEIAAPMGLELCEEIEMELLKSAVSRARPRAKDDYYESILVFRPVMKSKNGLLAIS